MEQNKKSKAIQEIVQKKRKEKKENTCCIDAIQKLAIMMKK